MNARADWQPLAEVFGTAASILTGKIAAEKPGLDPEPALDLLKRLDYLDGALDAAPHRAALLYAASSFRRIFSLRAEDAPGLVALGAEVDPGCIGIVDGPTGSVSGIGLSFRQAFESCVGEGAEYIAQFATPDDRHRRR